MSGAVHQRKPLPPSGSRAAATGDHAAAAPEVQQVLAQAGQPLPAPLRRHVEARFGQDFSAVRVHADEAAAASAHEQQAKAYTVGDHIVFGAGRFAPDDSAARRLLAHELAHVVQQRRGGAAPALDAGAAHERAADQAAAQFSTGPGPVQVAGATAVGVAREEDDEHRRPKRKGQPAGRPTPVVDPLEQELRQLQADAAQAGLPKKQVDQVAAEVRKRLRTDREGAEALMAGLEKRVQAARPPGDLRSQVERDIGEVQGKLSPDKGGGGKTRQTTADLDRAALEQDRPHPKTVLKATVQEGERLGTEGGKARAQKEGIQVADWDSPQHHVGEYGTGIDAWGVSRSGKVVIIENKYGSSGLNDSGGVRQMSNEWVGRRIAELEFVGDTATAQRLRDAARQGRLQGVVYWTREQKKGPKTTRRDAAQLRDKLGGEQISDSGLIQYAPGKVESAYAAHLAKLQQDEKDGTLPPNITLMRKKVAESKTPAAPTSGTPAAAAAAAVGKKKPAAKKAAAKKATAKKAAASKATPAKKTKKAAAPAPTGKKASGKKAAPKKAGAKKAAPKNAAATRATPKNAAMKAALKKAAPKKATSNRAAPQKSSAEKAAPPAPSSTAPARKGAAPSKKAAPPKKTPPPRKASPQPAAADAGLDTLTVPRAVRKKAPAPPKQQAPRPTPKKATKKASPGKKAPARKGAPAAPAPQAPQQHPQAPAGKPPAKASGSSTPSAPPKKPVNVQVRTTGFFKDQVRVSVAEQVGADKPYYVTTTFSLEVGGGIQASAQKGGTGASGHFSAQGRLSYATSHWMTEQEKTDYLASVARGRGGSQPEMTIVELIAGGNYGAAAEAIRKAQSLGGRQQGQVGDTEELAAEGDVSVGGGASRSGGGAGGGVNVQFAAGKGLRISRTLMPDGKELYTVTVLRRVGGTLGGSVSYNAVGGGYSYTGHEAGSEAVSILLDPQAPGYEARQREILAARSVEDLNAIAARTPGGPYGRAKDVDKSGTGTTSFSLFGVGLDLDQGTIDEEGETTDPSGTTRRLKGGASLGGSVTVLGHRLNPESRTDSFSAEVGPDNTARGVTQSQSRSVDVAKSAQNLADSFAASPGATTVGLVTGSKEVVKERVDTTGVNLENDSFTRIAETAKNPSAWFTAWDKRGVSRGAADEWEATRRAVLAAKGDRYLIAQAMKKWEQGDSGRSGDVERLAGDTGVAFDFPDEIADQKPVYDQLVSPGLLAGARQLAQDGKPAEARTQLEAINARAWRLLQTVQMHAGQSTDPAKFAEMQQRLGAVRRNVNAELARLSLPAAPGAAAAKAGEGRAEAPPVIGPPTAEQDAEAKAQALAARRQASDDVQTQVGICLSNRDYENRVFAEVEDELDDFYVDLAFVFQKLNSLKPMYARWDGAIEILKKAYPVQGDPPERADQFAPNRAKWNRLNQQALK